MIAKRSGLIGVLLVLPILTSSIVKSSNSDEHLRLTPIQNLGKQIFFDYRLSAPSGMACATCHGPSVGYTGDNEAVNMAGAVYPGAVPSRFGNRKPPSAAYGGESPVLTFESVTGQWIGGMFWDGRATGWTLGDPLAEQAKGPFLNPLEHNLPDAYVLCQKIRYAPYACLFKRVWGLSSIDCVNGAETVYEQAARSIAAYERSREVSPYNSKYDAYLNGEAQLTGEELGGLALFEGKAGCATCHPSAPDGSGAAPLFTDFTYDNLGVPRNEENPFYDMPPVWNPDGDAWLDQGMGGFLASAGYPPEVYEPELGKHKVPTLRNVDRRPFESFVKAYGHNGYFKSLEEIVHFYNTRDVDGAGWLGEPWPSPEIADNLNTAEMGDLGLTAEEEDAIVAFLKTLSDGYM